MNHKQFIKFAEDETAAVVETLRNKNADYSPGEDALRNIKAIEVINIPAPTAILARMFDKLMRVGSLLRSPAKVVTESIKDTLRDIIGYSILLLAYLHDNELP